MKKAERRDKIQRLIASRPVRTQEEIKEHLSSEGIEVTQATLSRDLRAIGLLKTRDDEGRHYYTISQTESTGLSTQAAPYVKTVDRAQFSLVIHTPLGEADLLANLIDGLKHDDILGTIAGADTLLVICRNEKTAMILEKDLKAFLK